MATTTKSDWKIFIGPRPQDCRVTHKGEVVKYVTSIKIEAYPGGISRATLGIAMVEIEAEPGEVFLPPGFDREGKWK